MARQVRHELKYYISRSQYHILSGLLKSVLSPDPNGDERNEYHIRSLYFDSIFDSALYDKVNGVRDRDKYRIRIYNLSDRLIRLECKSKASDYISKRSVVITRRLSEQIIAGDPSGLEHSSSGLLRELFCQMRLNLLRPVVIVDYVREAYVHPAEDIRITFDKQLRTGLASSDLFNPFLPTVPPVPGELLVLEVKFNRILPDYLSRLLSIAAGRASRSAISKYCICRQYEGKDN